MHNAYLYLNISIGMHFRNFLCTYVLKQYLNTYTYVYHFLSFVKMHYRNLKSEILQLKIPLYYFHLMYLVVSETNC